MKIKKVICTIGLVICCTNCSDYLDFVPEKDTLTIDAIFEKHTTAKDFLISCYQSLYNSVLSEYSPAYYGADEFMTGGVVRVHSYATSPRVSAFQIADGLQNASSPILGIWGDREGQKSGEHFNRYWAIRNCNIFIENIDRVNDITETEKAQYKAEAIAIKAYYYLELIMHYGPIVLVPENIPTSASLGQMQMPRQHVDTCFNRVVELFEQAIPYLNSIEAQPPSRKVMFTKEAAYAYRAKARLWQASPLFNGNEWYTNFKNRNGESLFSPSVDLDKWRIAAEAADEAVNHCEASGRMLRDDVVNQPSLLRNTIKNLHNKVFCEQFTTSEYIFAIWELKVTDQYLRLPRYNTKNSLFADAITGCVNPTIEMAELFYTENGLPINSDRSWNYKNRYKMGREVDGIYNGVVELNKDVLNLHLRREPRFYSNIGSDGCYWVRGVSSNGAPINVLMQAYRGAIHGVEDNRIISDRPQNLTGYWAKKFCHDEFNGRTGSPNKDAVTLMRLADLYLMQAEAWNEFEGPSSKVYDALNKIRRRAGIPDVQEAWMNYSTNPSKVSTLEGMQDIIRQERMIEFAFEGHRFWDIRRWKIAHTEMNEPLMGWNVFGENANSFYNNFEGPIIVYSNNKFEVPRDYFWPIRDEEVIVNNIVQNPGW